MSCEVRSAKHGIDALRFGPASRPRTHTHVSWGGVEPLATKLRRGGDDEEVEDNRNQSSCGGAVARVARARPNRRATKSAQRRARSWRLGGWFQLERRDSYPSSCRPACDRRAESI